MEKFLKIIVCLCCLLTGYACKGKPLQVQVKYSLHSKGEELYLDTVQLDTFTFTFNSGFHNDNVVFYHNGNKLADNTISSDPVSGAADVIVFKKNIVDYIQFSVNGDLSESIKLDKKFNQIVIDRDKQTGKIELCYVNYMIILD